MTNPKAGGPNNQTIADTQEYLTDVEALELLTLAEGDIGDADRQRFLELNSKRIPPEGYATRVQDDIVDRVIPERAAPFYALTEAEQLDILMLASEPRLSNKQENRLRSLGVKLAASEESPLRTASAAAHLVSAKFYALRAKEFQRRAAGREALDVGNVVLDQRVTFPPPKSKLTFRVRLIHEPATATLRVLVTALDDSPLPRLPKDYQVPCCVEVKRGKEVLVHHVINVPVNRILEGGEASWRDEVLLNADLTFVIPVRPIKA